MKPGAARFENPDEQRARDTQIMQARLTGMTQAAIAQQFGIGLNTVKRSLARAAADGLIQDAESSIVNTLVPLAIKVYEEKLRQDRDPFVAKHVLDQLSKMAERVENRQKHVEEMSLDVYMRERDRQSKEQKHRGEDVLTVQAVVTEVPVPEEQEPQ